MICKPSGNTALLISSIVFGRIRKLRCLEYFFSSISQLLPDLLHFFLVDKKLEDDRIKKRLFAKDMLTVERPLRDGART